MLLVCDTAVKTTHCLKESPDFVYSESLCRETKIFVYWGKCLVTWSFGMCPASSEYKTVRVALNGNKLQYRGKSRIRRLETNCLFCYSVVLKIQKINH